MAANLKNTFSVEGDMNIDVAGNVTLGDIRASKDLNIVGKTITLAEGSTLFSNHDTTLVSQQFNNSGELISERDMRIFSDQVRNSGQQAWIVSNNNMWIQKDAAGSKNTLIENKSGTIETINGDLIIRTENWKIAGRYLMPNG